MSRYIDFLYGAEFSVQVWQASPNGRDEFEITNFNYDGSGPYGLW